MTYPSSSLEALDAGGAFQIGGGSFNYGQDYTETAIRAMFKPAVPTPTNVIPLLFDALSKLPLEALAYFKDMIPDAIEGAFDTVSGAAGAIAGAIDGIMSAMAEAGKFLAEVVFNDWLANVFSGVSNALNQIIDILRGLIVTPINAAVQGVKDWWAANTSNVNRSEERRVGKECRL